MTVSLANDPDEYGNQTFLVSDADKKITATTSYFTPSANMDEETRKHMALVGPGYIDVIVNQVKGTPKGTLIAERTEDDTNYIRLGQAWIEPTAADTLPMVCRIPVAGIPADTTKLRLRLDSTGGTINATTDYFTIDYTKTKYVKA